MSVVGSIFRRRILFYIQFLCILILIIYYLGFRTKTQIEVDSQYVIPTENFTCVKTKYLLHLVQTTICVHDQRDALSNQVRRDKIWEEHLLIPLFTILIRYPQMSFIDAGANVGGYTMFAASFGRFHRMFSTEYEKLYKSKNSRTKSCFFPMRFI